MFNNSILMLDLEGTIIATAIPKQKQDYGIRPYAEEFLKITSLFEEVYLNTVVEESLALRIMRNVFGIENIKYYFWDKNSIYGKASGYERFVGKRLVHVEDGRNNEEEKRILQLGFFYVSVPTWTVKDAYTKKEDKSLLKAIEEINNIFR